MFMDHLLHDDELKLLYARDDLSDGGGHLSLDREKVYRHDTDLVLALWAYVIRGLEYFAEAKRE